MEIANYIKLHLAISRKIRTFIETHKNTLKYFKQNKYGKWKQMWNKSMSTMKFVCLLPVSVPICHESYRDWFKKKKKKATNTPDRILVATALLFLKSSLANSIAPNKRTFWRISDANLSPCLDLQREQTPSLVRQCFFNCWHCKNFPKSSSHSDFTLKKYWVGAGGGGVFLRQGFTQP